MKRKILAKAFLICSFLSLGMLNAQEPQEKAEAKEPEAAQAELADKLRVSLSEVKTLSPEDFGFTKYAFRATPQKDEVVVFRVVETYPESSDVSASYRDLITFSPNQEVTETVFLFQPSAFWIDLEEPFTEIISYRGQTKRLSPYMFSSGIWIEAGMGKQLIKDNEYFADEIFQQVQDPPYGSLSFRKMKPFKEEKLPVEDPDQEAKSFEFVMIVAKYDEVKKLYPELPPAEPFASVPKSSWQFNGREKYFFQAKEQEDQQEAE